MANKNSSECLSNRYIKCNPLEVASSIVELEKKVAALEESKKRSREAAQKWIEDLNNCHLWTADTCINRPLLSDILSEIFLELND